MSEQEDEDLPSWVKAAFVIEKCGLEPTCSSCGQSDICAHTDTISTINGSVVCKLCDRLLKGDGMKEEEYCASCGRKWVSC